MRNSLIINELKNSQNHDLQRTDFHRVKHRLSEIKMAQKFGILTIRW